MLWHAIAGAAAVAAAAAHPPMELTTPVKLAELNVDPALVIAAGVDNSADFAHQFHIAFSASVSGACVFSGQPFNCATTGFAGDTQEWHDAIAKLNGSASSKNDHCKATPSVVDIGSLVDYPRRHCGQNPVAIQDCFDDVNYVKHSRSFLYQSPSEGATVGTIENVDGLLAQMVLDPATSIKVVRPASTAEAAAIDAPGECLRHVLDDATLVPAAAVDKNWWTFDQREFFTDQIGFQDAGFVYVPSRCEDMNGEGPGSSPCPLIIRPDTCAPPARDLSADTLQYAAYAEANGLVLLTPCLGGDVDQAKFPHAPDVAEGRLDVYGQLDPNYVQQSAPHMKAIGAMMRRVVGSPSPPSPRPVQPLPPGKSVAEQRAASLAAATAAGLVNNITIVPLPPLGIDKTSVLTAGCSNTADFSHQFHVAFSSIVTGSCIFSGMPYHCAVTRFTKDYMVAKSNATAAGIHCDGCDSNGTLTYDHCKNHPHIVEMDLLWKYAEAPPQGHVIDNVSNLVNARVFSFGPTHDRCYQPPAMRNVANFHLRYAKDPSQVLLVEDQPFPHTLPTNETPYYNTHGNMTGALYDGPGECLRHVFGKGERLYPVPPSHEIEVAARWRRINNSEFVTPNNIAQGYKEGAWLFVPPQCEAGGCKLVVLPGGCSAYTDGAPPGLGPGPDNAFARYGMANGYVVLKPCQGGPIDKALYPNNHENLRGMVDVYGQLSPLYATQKGGQMEPTGKMIRRLLESV